MKRRCGVVVGIFAFIIGTAQADLILSNLDESTNGEALATIHDTDPAAYVGNQFTTGSSTGWEITSVTLDFGTHSATAGVFELRLYLDDGSDDLGALATTFTGPTHPAAETTVQYIPAGGSYAVNTNTTYWLLALALNDTSSYEWKGTTSTSETSPEGWTIDSSADFNTNLTQAGIYSTSQRFSIEAVPEPATMGLIGIFGLGLFLANRWYEMSG